MQKTTDKQIEKKLKEEIGSSFKEALEKSILSQKERTAAEKFVMKSIKKELKQTARAEVLKSAEYPEFIGRRGTALEKQRYEELIELLGRTEKALKFINGDNFIGLSFMGSWAKGTAGARSDVDVHVLLRDGSNNHETSLVMHEIGDSTDMTLRGRIFELEETKERIRNFKPSDGSKKSEDMEEVTFAKIFLFFNNRMLGDDDKIYAARKEIIEELAKNPHGELLWDDVRAMHWFGVVKLSKVTLFSVEHMAKRLGVSLEDFQEIVKAREEFILPTFEEMKKKYGVV
jgi:predicted nucleotidyltransferase